MSALDVRVGETRHTLEPGRTYSVGRGRERDIIIEDLGVSRHHADLEHDGVRWVYTDRSSAGSFVHEQPVSTMAVDRTVVVRLGPPGAPEIELEPAAVAEPEMPAEPDTPSEPDSPVDPVAPPVIDIADEDNRTIGVDDTALRLDVGDDNHVFPTGGRVVVGRDEDCDVVVPDRLVSARHWRLRVARRRLGGRGPRLD